VASCFTCEGDERGGMYHEVKLGAGGKDSGKAGGSFGRENVGVWGCRGGGLTAE
jgi:hypothetical protein